MSEPIEVTVGNEIVATISSEVVAEVGEEFVKAVLYRKVGIEAKLLMEKQAAYGPRNIANPPTGITPQVALLVRINDKLQRLSQLLSTNIRKPQGSESRGDSWLDGANYFTIGGMLDVDRTWPGSARAADDGRVG